MKVKLTAYQIAQFVNGQVEGDSEKEIIGVSKLEEANENTLCFYSNPKYLNQLLESNAGIVIVADSFAIPAESKSTFIKCSIPYLAFCQVLDKYFNPNIHKSGIEQGSFIDSTARVGKNVFVAATAYIDENAVIGNNVIVYPQVYIGKGVTVSDNTVLYSGVKIYSFCSVGKNCIIHSGTVIGSDGFGHAPMPDGRYAKIPQIGNVVIDDDVEIGSNCSIDRATMGSTHIMQGVKLDNLIQIAHNVEIGQNTVIASQTGVSGSVKLGNNCLVGGQVGFAGHITIADGSQFGAQSGVPKNITEPGKAYWGSPILPIGDQMKSLAVFRNLPELQKKVTQLENKINKLNSDD